MIHTIKVETQPHSIITVSGELATEEFEQYRSRALAKLNQEVKIDGFRPGQAPEAVLRERLGEGKILETMAGEALTEYYPKLLAQEKIDAIGQPRIELTKLALGNPLGFKITTAIYPKFTLPDYQTIAQTEFKTTPVAENIEVSEEEIDKVLAELEKIKKPAPTREQIKDFLGKDKARAERDKRRLRLLDNLLAATAIDLPEILIETEIHKMLMETKAQVEQIGLKFPDYLARLKKTAEDLKKEWQTPATKRVKVNLLFDQIAIKENLKAPAEEVEQETKKFLAQQKDAAPARVRAYFEHLIISTLVWEFLEGKNNPVPRGVQG